MAALKDRYSAAMTARRCPICDRPADPGIAPFCSKRCADVDLHRWLSGGYVIPGGGDDEDDALPDQDGTDSVPGHARSRPL
jgi:endogenous inhibitor of DNA gyrase (YacG/DUF329 family)